jgi:hypothetical protein
MRKIIVAMGTMSLALLASCTPTLAGKLVGPGGEMVASPDARVNITPVDAVEGVSLSVVAEVEADGTWSTRETLQDGAYVVEALVPGFRVQSEKVLLPGQRHVELKLVPVVAPKAAPIGANADIDLGRGAGGAELTPPQL